VRERADVDPVVVAVAVVLADRADPCGARRVLRALCALGPLHDARLAFARLGRLRLLVLRRLASRLCLGGGDRDQEEARAEHETGDETDDETAHQGLDGGAIAGRCASFIS
jgi:hypothetical protein